MEQLNTAGLKVARGAEWLDAYRQGWETEIDADQIDISDIYHCILGQLFGDFLQAKEDKGLSWDETREFGFMASGDAQEEELNNAWRNLIAQRLAL